MENTFKVHASANTKEMASKTKQSTMNCNKSDCKIQRCLIMYFTGEEIPSMYSTKVKALFKFT